MRGRKSGEWRATPVNLLSIDTQRYLVAPRGETQWVRNLRVAGAGELRVGRRIEAFTATEIADADKVLILRAYLKRWKAEVGVFFDGVGARRPTTTSCASRRTIRCSRSRRRRRAERSEAVDARGVAREHELPLGVGHVTERAVDDSRECGHVVAGCGKSVDHMMFSTPTS